MKTFVLLLAALFLSYASPPGLSAAPTPTAYGYHATANPAKAAVLVVKEATASVQVAQVATVSVASATTAVSAVPSAATAGASLFYQLNGTGAAARPRPGWRGLNGAGSTMDATPALQRN